MQKKKLNFYNIKRSSFKLKSKKFFNERFNITNTYLKLYLYYKYLIKYGFKYSKIPIFNLSNHYKDFRKFQLFFVEPTLLPQSYSLNFPQSFSNSNQFFNINVTTKNLNKSCFLSEEVFKKILIFPNDNIWYYYFYIMYKTNPSSLLIGNFIKKFLGKKSLRKKQKFFLNSLRRFIISFKKKKLFEKIKGLKIQIKGKLNGKDRSLIYRIRLGSMPLSTISQKINYNLFPVNTLFGCFGVKIWIAVKNVST